jgi:hypothetical protein
MILLFASGLQLRKMQKPLSYFVIRVNPELQHDLQVRFDDDALPKLSYFLVEQE